MSCALKSAPASADPSLSEGLLGRTDLDVGESALRSLRLGIALVAAVLVSCASASFLPALGFDFFVPAGREDPWNEKIQNWQTRHRLDPAARGEAMDRVSDLGSDWRDFERDLRRRIASDTVAWVQKSSHEHYRADGAQDHWATLGEVIESGQDDCDGLDLLTFVLLRRMGFAEKEIYRAIVVEDSSGQHHMVTLWFENGARSDPFVLDPTGVVTAKMVRLSRVSSWEPIELFDEGSHFAVRSTSPAALVAAE